ncbi:MAG: bifunctional diaminohydroxyphosphoribosylaminopyrimidine deaminase/5-amino-6-(5-phosphoribosylamino)uracil reductase RibD [Pseudomonadota bacterium]|nr:bifunctional diaminohydroxyphosphoribosylaminopyrimidine deaminase/5-amino-6-(5-phosphoribosylamino)uracil reductase RibD [Pseudomonadota bacterium]
MRQALDLARQARWHCPPNPAVGCVLVNETGEVIGAGHTQPVGQAHAEVMALRDAAARGHATAGATAYVTLEPCAHQGRTGPCCDALVAAGVRRVVAAVQDPNPRVAGQGFARLRAAGVAVALGTAAQAHEARELNIGFFHRMTHGLPWVRMKVASSLDGRTALPNGVSQWITSPEARADGHAWRARACAVLTGIGTVLEDNPRLDARLPGVARQPVLVLVDSRLQTPLDAALWQVAGRQVLVYTAEEDSARHQPLLARGAEVVPLPDVRGKVDLAAMRRDLARRELNEVHVEAGFKLNGSLLREALVDELLLYQAPLLLGEGAGVAAVGPLHALAQGVRMAWAGAQPVGPDMRVLARVLPREGEDSA